MAEQNEIEKKQTAKPVDPTPTGARTVEGALEHLASVRSVQLVRR